MGRVLNVEEIIDALIRPAVESKESDTPGCDDLMRLIEGWSQSLSASECEEILLSAGVPCTRYQEIGEVLRDPQVVSRQSLTLVHDAAGDYLVPNAPFQFKGQPLPAASWVSSIGQHSQEVLNALLGYSEEQARASAGRFSEADHSTSRHA